MRSELATRTFSGVILGAAVLFITYWNPLSFAIMCLWGGWILWREWRALTRARSRWFIPGGLLYLGAAIASLIAIRYSADGIVAIYRLFALVWAIDIGGYVVGKLIGKHKIAPGISPGKSWEGLVGSILFAAITLYLLTFFTYYSTHVVDHSAPLHGSLRLVGFAFSLVLGTVFALLGLAGDLFESSLKRRAGVKDSGTLIPGHGGLFDRVDALIPIAISMGAMLLLTHFTGAAQ